MSTQWTAPGAPDPAPGAPGPVPGAYGAPGPAPSSGTAGPQRELTQSMPLFPLRPLGVGEVLGAAVRIYRLRARSVLGVAAAVYGVAFVIMTLSTGASMVPMLGDMQSMFDDPDAPSTAFTSVQEIVLFILSTAVTGVITMVATALVTVALTRVALGEATGEHVPTAQMWATMRRRGLPALGTSLLLAVLGAILFAVPFLLGLAPILIVQEPGWLTILPILLGTLVGLLAMLWLWARTVLAIPSLVLEDLGVLGAIRRGFALTRGRRFWRVLGIAVLLYALYMVVVQVISGVIATIAGIAYVAILLVSSFEAVVLGVAVMTILAMLGSYLATFLLAPFLCSGIAALYADVRMRDEAWDVELTRRAREAWAADGTR